MTVLDWFRVARTPRTPIANRTIASAARSHIGLVRKVNEDRLVDLPEQGLWAIADGMGGHGAGDVAATTITDALSSLAVLGSPIADEALRQAIAEANSTIFCAADGQSGSTIAILKIDAGRFTALWAGDSRIYRVREGRVEQLTRDHSLVQELIDAGELSREGATSHPYAHVITRAVGTAEDVVVEALSDPVAPGDRFILCSDGLSGLLPDHLLATTTPLSPQRAVDFLMEAALAAGGNDNVSVIVVDAPA